MLTSGKENEFQMLLLYSVASAQINTAGHNSHPYQTSHYIIDSISLAPHSPPPHLPFSLTWTPPPLLAHTESQTDGQKTHI